MEPLLGFRVLRPLDLLAGAFSFGTEGRRKERERVKGYYQYWCSDTEQRSRKKCKTKAAEASSTFCLYDTRSHRWPRNPTRRSTREPRFEWPDKNLEEAVCDIRSFYRPDRIIDFRTYLRQLGPFVRLALLHWLLRVSTATFCKNVDTHERESVFDKGVKCSRTHDVS